jgi:hypothetical protein
MSDDARDTYLSDKLAKLSSRTLANMLVVLASGIGYRELDEDARYETLEALIPGLAKFEAELDEVAPDIVERFIADALGEPSTNDG